MISQLPRDLVVNNLNAVTRCWREHGTQNQMQIDFDNGRSPLQSCFMNAVRRRCAYSCARSKG